VDENENECVGWPHKAHEERTCGNPRPVTSPPRRTSWTRRTTGAGATSAGKSEPVCKIKWQLHSDKTTCREMGGDVGRRARVKGSGRCVPGGAASVALIPRCRDCGVGSEWGARVVEPEVNLKNVVPLFFQRINCADPMGGRMPTRLSCVPSGFILFLNVPLLVGRRRRKQQWGGYRYRAGWSPWGVSRRSQVRACERSESGALRVHRYRGFVFTS
jgi:hypothetical protein